MLAYRRKSRLLLIAVIIPFSVSLAFLASCRAPGELVMACIFGTAVALAAIGYGHRYLPKFEAFAPVYLIPSLATYWFLVYLLTFEDIAEEMLDIGSRTINRFWIAGLAAPLLAIIGWVALGIRTAIGKGRGEKGPTLPPDRFLMPLACLLLLVMALVFPRGAEGAAMTCFNLVFLAHAAATMAAGARDGDFGVAALGSVLLVFLTGARYVDLFEAGIVDPTKVVRIALENAVSVASVLLLTEATMTEVPEEEKRQPAEPEMGM